MSHNPPSTNKKYNKYSLLCPESNVVSELFALRRGTHKP